MSALSTARVGAVLVADLRARLRRPAVAVLVAGAAVGAVLMIPDPGPGSGLVMIGGARALYTSPTLAFATATLLSLLLSFFGFYVAGHALGRDVRARLGGVLASTPVSNVEYLAGKLLGSVALLGVVAAGFLAAAMAMQLVRGEGPLEPWTYLAHYAVLTLPCIVWVSALALVFECTPGLSGRLGDLAYFLVWGGSVPRGIVGWKSGGPWRGRVFDFTGIGFVVSQVERIAGTRQFTIGYAPGDATRAPLLFPGLSFPPEVLGARALSLLAPLLIAPVALLLFRRFDPARTQRTAGAGRFAVPAWAEKAVAAITRPALAPLLRLAPDVALGFRTRPLLAALVPAFAFTALGLPAEAVRQGLLPVVFAALSVALADLATRERACGMAALVFSTPRRRERFATWKLGSALGTAWLLAGVPVLRLLWAEPRAGVSAAIGISFLAAASVALGIASGTPKTFVAASLALWYLSLNAKTSAPALDFGGWWAVATPWNQAAWAAATLAAVVLAVAAHRRRLAVDS